MSRTVVVSDQDLASLGAKLNGIGESFDEGEQIALLTVFELASEALDARLDDNVDVAGFAQQQASYGIQVGVPNVLPGLGDGLLTSMKGKSKPKGEAYMQVKLQDCLISSY